MFDFLIFVVYLTVENGLIRIRHLRTPVENMARACWTVHTRMGARPGSRLDPDSTKMFTMYDVITLIPAHWVIIIRAPILNKSDL